MKGPVRTLAIGALLTAAALFALARSGTVAPPLEPGREAPSFELASVDGGAPVSLASLRGKVVLLNFWATWCKPCEDEMPAMERLYRSLAGEPFELVAVSVDVDAAPVRAFRERLGLSFPLLLDPDRNVADAYQSYRFPESWLIDASGTLVARYVGPREWDAPEYEARVRRLLEAPGAPAAASGTPRYAAGPVPTGGEGLR